MNAYYGWCSPLFCSQVLLGDGGEGGGLVAEQQFLSPAPTRSVPVFWSRESQSVQPQSWCQ